MSDLIEKVRDAIVKNESETFKDQARAAIAVVAEWLAQSEDRECNPLQAISAALRAAGCGG